MEFLKRMWKKITILEIIAVLVTLAFILITEAIYHGWFLKLNCPLCRRELEPGEYYLFDIRSGDTLELFRYLSGDRAIFWFGGTYHSPQKLSPSRRCGYARFPAEVENPARYCPDHCPPFSIAPQDFYLLSQGEDGMIFRAIPDEGTTAPGGQTILKQYNESLHCWELVIQW